MMMRVHRRNGKSLLILLVVCALVSIAAGVGIGLFMGRRALGRKTAPGKGESAKSLSIRKPQTVFSLGEMVVNLADTDSLRYAKLSVALGLAEKLSEDKVKEHVPVMRDAVIDVLTAKQFRDLHRKGGVQQLKSEIRALTSRRVQDATIVDVYFESFAMQ